MRREGFNPGAGVPPEAGEQQSVDAIRKQKSLQIINSLLTDGLVPQFQQKRQGDELFVSGTGSIHEGAVYGNIVVPQSVLDSHISIFDRRDPRTKIISIPGFLDHYEYQRDENESLAEVLVQSALYGAEGGPDFGPYSVLPVIAEREHEYVGKAKELPVEQVEDRFAQSVLIVAPLVAMSQEEFEPSNLKDVRFRGIIMPDKFSIVLPKDTKQELEGGIKGTNDAIRTVGYIKKENPYGRSYVVPDYESATREMLEETGEPLFLHGVRLPTNEDVEMGRV